MKLKQVRRRTLKEYMEWLLLNRHISVCGARPYTVTQVDVESDGWLILHHDSTYEKIALAEALEFELVEGE